MDLVTTNIVFLSHLKRMSIYWVIQKELIHFITIFIEKYGQIMKYRKTYKLN